MFLALNRQGRDWVEMNCVVLLEVCVRRGDVCTACAEVRDSLLKLELLTSFQSLNEQERDQSWSYLRTAIQIPLRVVSMIKYLWS